MCEPLTGERISVHHPIARARKSYLIANPGESVRGDAESDAKERP